jgi:hypothetical protein
VWHARRARPQPPSAPELRALREHLGQATSGAGCRPSPPLRAPWASYGLRRREEHVRDGGLEHARELRERPNRQLFLGEPAFGPDLRETAPEVPENRIRPCAFRLVLVLSAGMTSCTKPDTDALMGACRGGESGACRTACEREGYRGRRGDESDR